jgi:hypothetical protein
MEYRNHRYLDGPGIKNLTEGCDIDCRNEFYCQTTSNDYDEWQFCKDRGLFDLFNGWPIESFQNFFNHNWYVPIDEYVDM